MSCIAPQRQSLAIFACLLSRPAGYWPGDLLAALSHVHGRALCLPRAPARWERRSRHCTAAAGHWTLLRTGRRIEQRLQWCPPPPPALGVNAALRCAYCPGKPPYSRWWMVRRDVPRTSSVLVPEKLITLEAILFRVDAKSMVINRWLTLKSSDYGKPLF